MHIAICDDKKDDALYLAGLLQSWLTRQQLTAEISVFNSGEALLQAWQPHYFQIVFMDIYLEDKSGIDVCRALRATDKACAIILTTVSTDHGLEGFAVDASHYLIKPIRPQSLAEALRRCRHLLEAHARYLDVIENRLPLRLLLRDIKYIEVYGNNSKIFTADREVKVYTTLDKLLEQLDSPPFVRCHRSYVVNLRHAEHPTEKEFPLLGGGSVPISRSYRQATRQLYDDYLGSLIQQGRNP